MPEVLRTLAIAVDQTSTIWDHRGETNPHGGRIALRACVHHLPGPTVRAGRVFQFGTDADGNIALYTRADRLCFQANGANQASCGIEHVGGSVGEEWSAKQLRAAAWIAQYLEREFDVPLQIAHVEPNGPGLVRIVRKGHTSGRDVAHLAGFGDRIDPAFDYEHMFHAARFFKSHGHFVGA
jgi:N-acetylmuramoyl-L-alanine amidase